MKFGPVLLAEAEGAILAHSLGVGGRRLKKGRVLSASDVATLAAAGFDEVTVARPEAGDLGEDAAAARVAAALVPDAARAGLSIAAPFTGRANVYAEAPGVLGVDAPAVGRANEVDEAITLATLPDCTRVAARQMVATVKIIPYGAPDSSVAAVERMLEGRGALCLHPLAVRSATLILTRTPGMADKLVSKGADAVRARLTALGIHEVQELVVAHEIHTLSAAMAEAVGDLTLILTGSATSDRSDVGPAALMSSGGQLIRFGMPVDPGNLLFLGTREGRPVLGLPGCARSPRLNGADWVLERLACGLEVSSAEISRMGVGGLLKEIPSRPEPRGGGASAPRRPEIAALMLAAGGSTRMRGRDKLLETVSGQPLIAHTAGVLSASGVDSVTCVLRPDDTARRAALAEAPVTLVENSRAAEGMGTSLSAGIRALGAQVDGVLVMLADMPGVTAKDVDRLLAAFDPDEGRAIVRATAADGTPGHPVLFGRRFFEALGALEGDTGARAVVAEHAEFVVDVALSSAAALVDLDTPEDWAAWRSRA